MSKQPTDPQLKDGMSNVWIYSFNPDVGARVQWQLPIAVLNQVNDPALKGDQLAAGVATIIEMFDKLSEKRLTQKEVDTLISGIIIYARSTAAWGLMPKLDSVVSIHLVVVDWRTARGVKALKVAGAKGDARQPIAPDVIMKVGMAGIDQHVRHHPHDAQAGDGADKVLH
jgi:hypothetical protein